MEGYVDAIGKVEVAGKARSNYTSVFVGRAEPLALGLSSLSLEQVPFIVMRRPKQPLPGAGGLRQHLAQISFYLQIPDFIVNSGTFVHPRYL